MLLPRRQCADCLYRLRDGTTFYCQYILATEKQRPEPTTPGVCPVKKYSAKPYFKEDDSFGLF